MRGRCAARLTEDGRPTTGTDPTWLDQAETDLFVFFDRLDDEKAGGVRKFAGWFSDNYLAAADKRLGHTLREVP